MSAGSFARGLARIAMTSLKSPLTERVTCSTRAVCPSGPRPRLMLFSVCFSSGLLRMSISVPLKAKQTPTVTERTSTQMMSRDRSSSRCSMRLSRSSWPTGLRSAVDAMRGPLGALVDVLGRRRRVGLAGRLRRRDLRRLVVLVVLGLAGDAVLELPHPRAQLLAQARQSLGPEDQQDDEQYDAKFEGSDGHVCPTVPLTEGFPDKLP